LEYPIENIGDRQITNPHQSHQSPNTGELVITGENGLTNDFQRNIGKKEAIGDWLVKNKEKKSGGGYLVVKPFSWRGRDYLQGSFLKEGDFTLGELQALKDAGHIKLVKENRNENNVLVPYKELVLQ